MRLSSALLLVLHLLLLPDGNQSLGVLTPYRTLRLVPVTNDAPSPLHSSHLCHFLSAEDAQWVIDEAEAFAGGGSGGGGAEEGTWLTDRHAQYATTDFAVEDCPSLREWWMPRIRSTVLPTLATLFEVAERDLEVDDLFIVKYEANDDVEEATTKSDSSSGSSSSSSSSSSGGGGGSGSSGNSGNTGGDGSGDPPRKQDRLKEHYDDTLLSFSVLLSDPAAFAGGGTSFSASDWVEEGEDFRAVVEELEGTGAVPLVDVVRPARQGDLFAHCGRLLHGGAPVTKGKRLLLVGFVHVAGRRAAHDAYEEFLVGMGRLRHARRLAESPRLRKHRAFERLALRPFQMAAQAQLEYEYASVALDEDCGGGELGDGEEGGGDGKRRELPPEFTIVEN